MTDANTLLGIVCFALLLSSAVALCALIIQARTTAAITEQADKMRRSVDDALMQVVALKSPYAAQAFGAAKQAQMAEAVASEVARAAVESGSVDTDPDEGRYG